jgi:hypothetical protein
MPDFRGPTCSTVRFGKKVNVLCVSKTILRVRHSLSRQPAGRKAPCVRRDLRYGDFGFHCMFIIQSSDFIMMMYRFTSLSENHASSKMFETQYISVSFLWSEMVSHSSQSSIFHCFNYSIQLIWFKIESDSPLSIFINEGMAARRGVGWRQAMHLPSLWTKKTKTNKIFF